MSHPTSESDLQSLDEWSSHDESTEYEDNSAVLGSGTMPPTVHLSQLNPEEALKAISNAGSDKSSLRTSSTASQQPQCDPHVDMMHRVVALMRDDVKLRRCVQADINMVQLQEIMREGIIPHSILAPWMQEEKRAYKQNSEAVNRRPKSLRRKAVKVILLSRVLTSILKHKRNHTWPIGLGVEFEKSIMQYLKNILSG
jgi:hypothetical protein